MERMACKLFCFVCKEAWWLTFKICVTWHLSGYKRLYSHILWPNITDELVVGCCVVILISVTIVTLYTMLWKFTFYDNIWIRTIVRNIWLCNIISGNLQTFHYYAKLHIQLPKWQWHCATET